MFEETDSVLNISNISYKSFKTQDLLLQNSYCDHRNFDRAKKKIYGFPVFRPYLAFGRRNPDPKLFYWIMLVSVST
jgi:hypothetical protein